MGQGFFTLLRPAVSTEVAISETKKRKPGQDYDHLVKIMLIGDSGVGKSSLLLRFSDDSFDMNCTPTIGIDFKLRTIDLDQKKIKMQLLDTAGQERFKAITTAHYRNAHGILLVYDVTNEKSFRNVQEWLQNIDKHVVAPVNKILIGNKADLKSQRKVSKREGKKLADELGIAFFETSAKDRSLVDEAFLALTRQVTERISKAPKLNPNLKCTSSTICTTHSELQAISSQ